MKRNIIITVGLIAFLVIYIIRIIFSNKDSLVIHHLIPYKFEGEIYCEYITQANYQKKIENNILSIKYDKSGKVQIARDWLDNKKVSEEYFFWIKEDNHIVDSISLIDYLSIKGNDIYFITERVNDEEELSSKLKSFPIDKFKYFNPVLCSTILEHKDSHNKIVFNKTENYLKYLK